MKVRSRLGAVTAVAAAISLGVSGLAAAATDAQDGPVDAGITVPKVEGMGADWINGADFSTVLSLEESGVTFEDFDGNDADLFEVLADAGVNYARVRVWNEPFLSSDPTQGYGAGNVDAERATEIGRRATEAGMKVLVNFHYADFWAHPGQQPSPRAWQGMNLQDRTQALYDYTADTLTMMNEAGVDVGMVQIGNETTGGAIAGVTGWSNTAQLFQAGSQAVRDTLDDDVKVAVHFTNPERSGQYASVARELDERDVDYDVFLSSYYAFWHGSLSNLTSVLNQVATTYDKEVAVAETSWVYTLEDGDGDWNSVDTAHPAYSASVQGQALALRDVMQAVAHVDEGRGLGTFYWEPAWLPVGPADQRESNWELWEQHGSGWANPVSQEFYSSFKSQCVPYTEELTAAQWCDVYGGSGWDNQALFDFTGKPLESLRTYQYAITGAQAPREVDAVGEAQVTILDGEEVSLPSTVTVSYTDGTSEDQDVVWNFAQSWIAGPGSYTVSGATADGHEARAVVTVLAEADAGRNYVVNPGFEDGAAPWTGTGSGYTISSTDDPRSGERSLHYYSGNDFTFSVEQIITDVPRGEYRLSASAQGRSGDELEIFAQSGISTVTALTTLRDWDNWQTPTTAPITVGADGVVTIGIGGSLSSGAWGTIDDFALVAMSDDDSADTAALAALVAEAEGLDRNAFTAESLVALDDALARAHFVLASGDPSQSSVDGAVSELEDARTALVPSASFTDVTQDSSEFYSEIMWLANQGITKGWTTPAGQEFRPRASITRDAMAAFLYRFADEPEVTLPAESPFVDVTPTSTEFYTEIMWLEQQGIGQGWSTSQGAEFRPLRPITRDAMAAFLYRYAEEPEWDAPEVSPFEDISATNTEFYSEITWLESTGITNGYEDGMFKPRRTTDREVMAAFLYRFDGLSD